MDQFSIKRNILTLKTPDTIEQENKSFDTSNPNISSSSAL